MHIREYTHDDLAALRTLHAAQGMPYAFPDLANPLFLTRLVAVNDGNNFGARSASGAAPFDVKSAGFPSDSRRSRAGAPHAVPACEFSSAAMADAVAPRDSEIIAAVFLRLTAEAYFLVDPRAGTPRDRWRALLLLHEAARGDANRRGLDDAHAWLPPQVARQFGRRIEQLGWTREPWPSYSRTIHAQTPGL
jgi:hypothetical protein